MNKISPYNAPLNEIFPRENYKKSGKGNTLQFLIALKQKDATIIQWLDEHPEYLNTQNKNYRNLTPLAVAVMRGNTLIIQKLLEKGASPTARDYKQWTPLHHAAVVGDQTTLDLLIQKVGNEAAAPLRNESDGSYLDIQNLLSGYTPFSAPPKIYYHHEDREAEELSPEQFKQLTGADYTPYIIMSREGMAARWAENHVFSQQHPEFYEVLHDLIGKYFENPPKLSIGKSRFIPDQFDVYAEEDIEAFRTVSIYGGELTASDIMSTYYSNNIDGKNFRNASAMINDSFPNVMAHNASWEGFEYFIFTAQGPIKKGEPLFCDYTSGHTVKMLEPHLEGNVADLKRYVKTSKLYEDYLSLSKPPILTGEQTKKTALLAFLSKREKLYYLLDTPTAWVHLLIEGIFPKEDLLRIFTSRDPELESASNFEKRMQMLKVCAHMSDAFKELDDSSKAIVKKILIAWHEKYPAAVTMSVMDIASHLITTSQDLENDLKHIDGFICPIHQSAISRSGSLDPIKNAINAYKIASKPAQKLMRAYTMQSIPPLTPEQMLLLTAGCSQEN